MNHVLIINGVAKSGKDSFVDFLEKSEGVFHIVRTSTVDKVKEIAAQMGCDVINKSDADRKFLSDIKMAWTNFNDGIFKSITHMIDNEFEIVKYDGHFDTDEIIVTVMCREPEEIEKFVEYYGRKTCKTILVERPGIAVPDNHGDQSVFDYGYDYIITNDGNLEKLETTAYEFVGALTYKK